MLIAQISDIHASAQNDNLSRLELAVDWLSCVRPDVTILTGDLVDGSWADGYREIRRSLEGFGSPFIVLSGNADDPAIMRSVFAETQNWGSSAALHTEREFGQLRVIGLDVTVAGEAHGDLMCHFDWLERRLTASGGSKTIIFTHQHLFPTGIEVIDSSICRGIERFESLVLLSDIMPMAISSGHVHRPMASVIAGVPSYICGSISPANPLLFDSSRNPPVTDPPCLMIHDFRSGRLVSNHVSIATTF